MRKTAQKAVVCAADRQTRHCPAFCGRDIGGGGETSGRRRGRAGTAAAAPLTQPDGPLTDSEHAECMLLECRI